VNDLFLDEIVRPEEPSNENLRSARRAERAERDRKRRMRRRRSLIAVLVSLAILGGGAFAVVKYALPMLHSIGSSATDATDYPGPGHGSVEVTIADGATGADMGAALVEAGVVQTARAFTTAFAADPGASKIQPGTYRLQLEMPAADAVAALQESKNRVETKITIPEGLTQDQILEKLSSITALPLAQFQAAMQDTAATGLPAEAGGNYEGWLFASTYTFQPGTTPTQMISAMVAQTVAKLDARAVAPADRETVLTKAALVEREARTPEDRAKVARAIENRLAQDMKLDIDAAVAYGLKKPGTELTSADKDVDTPYNLYLHTGLPPTPIASPSEVSIDAVLHPADGKWLFWVTVNLDTGETRFAETFAEHQVNVQALRDWQSQNQG
jgi:UPF0755 protein